MKKIQSIIAIALFITLFSCEKPAGEGGNSSVKGNVWVEKWNGLFTVLTNEGPGLNVDVFIIYGDETSYGDKISTGPDGTFEFKYLRPGKYKIYVYSKTTTAVNANAKEAVSLDVEISKKKEKIDIGQITVKI